MNARTTLLDLYGDYVGPRGGNATVAALVLLLRPLGIAAPAVRTAVSRMVKRGWLMRTRIDCAPGYALTERAARRLAAVNDRLYGADNSPWDGSWHVVVPQSTHRAARERLRNELAYLGYAPVGDGTWIAARPSPELTSLLETEQLVAEHFSARHEGDNAALVRRAWDLEAVARSYARWLTRTQRRMSELPVKPSDELAFAARSFLVQEWRKFLFTDPKLPNELLPAQWPGHEAASFVTEHTARLEPAAGRFVDRCLAYPRSRGQ